MQSDTSVYSSLTDLLWIKIIILLCAVMMVELCIIRCCTNSSSYRHVAHAVDAAVSGVQTAQLVDRGHRHQRLRTHERRPRRRRPVVRV